MSQKQRPTNSPIRAPGRASSRPGRLLYRALGSLLAAAHLGGCLLVKKETTFNENGAVEAIQRSDRGGLKGDLSETGPPATPVIRIGPCLGAKIAARVYLFAAPCLFAGATYKFRMEFVPGRSTVLTADNGNEWDVIINETAVFPDFDPVTSREELRNLASPRSRNRFARNPANLAPYFDYQEHAQPRMVNLALVTTTTEISAIPVALLKAGSEEESGMVMVSNFGCLPKGQQTLLTPKVIGPPHPGLKDSHPMVRHDAAAIVATQKLLVYVEGVAAAFPRVATLEPLCWGTHGSPIMTRTAQGYRLVGLGLARTKGLVVGARTDGPVFPQLDSWVKSLLPPKPSAPKGAGSTTQSLNLSCTQVLTLMPDSGPRQYQFRNLQFALAENQSVTAASDFVILSIEPHDRPAYELELDLADHCTTLASLCYVGVYKDPITAGLQVVKLEVSSQGAALAHWISADGGARTTPFDTSACQTEL